MDLIYGNERNPDDNAWTPADGDGNNNAKFQKKWDGVYG